jgi:RNA polymerase sigma-B factor
MATVSATTASAAETVPALPAPAGRIRPDLGGLDDRELLDIVRSLPRSSERRAAACELLVGRYRNVVWSCVQRYRRGPEPAEDLMQAGYVGLVKAINNFDPAFGRSLAAYARPCITGEIKRHFRDKRWQVHVERPVQELVLQVREATWQLTQQLGHMPADAELASHLGVSDADIRDARRAELVLQPRSLDEPAGGQAGPASLADLLGEEDQQLDHMLGMQAVATHWGELPLREQKILLLRFYGGMTQAQVGQQLGISQMHVSRLLAHALGYLRPRLIGLASVPAGHGAGTGHRGLRQDNAPHSARARAVRAGAASGAADDHYRGRVSVPEPGPVGSRSARRGRVVVWHIKDLS